MESAPYAVSVPHRGKQKRAARDQDVNKDPAVSFGKETQGKIHAAS